MTGRLISIEGIDFAGKTTQVALLRQTLEKYGQSVSSFKFPDDQTEVGKLLRDILRGNTVIETYAMFALFSVNRLERKSAIEEAWRTGNLVIFDRYSESEYAYGGAEKCPEDWLLALESQMPVADLVLLLDIDPSLAFRRAESHKERDIFERSINFLSKVRQRYLELAICPLRPDQQWEVIDATKTIDIIHKIIMEKVLTFLRQKSML